MQDKQLKTNSPPKIWDNTMLSNFTTCPRKFYWFSRGLDCKERPAYFTWGTAWGALINTWHSGQGTDRQGRMLDTMAALNEHWIESPGAIELNSRENLIQVFQNYIKVYGEEEPWEILYEGNELGFTIPIPGSEFLYAGAIDGAIQWKPYGNLVLENKTTGMYIGDSYMNQYEHSSQVTGYYWAFSELVGQPFGVYLNVASKRKRKEIELQFVRQLSKRGDFQVENFIKEVKLLIEDIQREYDRWLWPKYGEKNPMNCSGGAGKSPCLYRRLCTQEFEPWELDESGYDYSTEFNTREEWKPWARGGKEGEE